MKRFGIWLFIGVMLISLLSCKNMEDPLDVEQTLVYTENEKEETVIKDSEPSSAPDTSDDLISGEQPEFEGVTLIDWTDEEKIIRFPDQDFDQWKEYANDDTVEIVKLEESYPALMERIGEDGLIAAVRAYGDREGHITSLWGYTWTNVKIEKVFYGTASSDKIRVKEGYVPVSKNGKNYIRNSGRYSRLRNNELMLLFLDNLAPEEEGYRVAYYQFPLQEGYQNYSEEYLTELLDFYRGDRNMYKGGNRAPQKPFLKQEEDGTYVEVVYPGDERFWPQKDLSNEEMLEELSDNILVQVAANHKVCLWPKDHIRYQHIDCYSGGIVGIRKWSEPPKNY